ncbi:MAG TPA: mycofactocin radical SAM maturase [Amycolatopsis sp.]|uniref:mycofactocin radical SAM maturase n=1 Tax=Amycolatopsis sp. TaxID=37632 RepID=UPI002B499809|nr:mycofactocin radical SAM maturase [Amycolatopsis sp.]HKS48636.1 mycofactocin radical SAM maturase [Amycolatopsis sp.]
MKLVEHFKQGLTSPICLTWELTYACNLACVHCLSSSGRRDPRELSTEECKAVIDELERMQVFYVNIGGGEPTVRADFWELVEYAVAHHVGVKFSTNGVKLPPERARWLAGTDYVDVQISLDGATAEVNDAVRGHGSFDIAVRAMRNLAGAGFRGFRLSIVMTRQNIGQLDAFAEIADTYGAQLRITRLRPSGRGADVWDELHPTPAQQLELYEWLVAHGEGVLTGDSFFHLNALGSDPLPGLNLCGAGRVVCLIDPVGDVYACPFAIHQEFLAGNVGDEGGFAKVWADSALFTRLRGPHGGATPSPQTPCTSCSAYDSCQGGCMAAKFFTGLPLDGPDPECVKGHGERALRTAGPAPRSEVDHSRQGRGVVPVQIGFGPPSAGRPDRACDTSPLAGLR